MASPQNLRCFFIGSCLVLVHLELDRLADAYPSRVHILEANIGRCRRTLLDDPFLGARPRAGRTRAAGRATLNLDNVLPVLVLARDCELAALRARTQATASGRSLVLGTDEFRS